jgi:hypothetical protein
LCFGGAALAFAPGFAAAKLRTDRSARPCWHMSSATRS